MYRLFSIVGLAAVSHLGEAFVTVHRSIALRLEGNLAILAAGGADCGVHLAGGSAISGAVASLRLAAFLATRGLAPQTTRLVKFLFPGAELKLFAAISTH
jgi:hypothetical protein